jgi:hypothetical protein
VFWLTREAHPAKLHPILAHATSPDPQPGSGTFWLTLFPEVAALTTPVREVAAVKPPTGGPPTALPSARVPRQGKMGRSRPSAPVATAAIGHRPVAKIAVRLRPETKPPSLASAGSRRAAPTVTSRKFTKIAASRPKPKTLVHRLVASPPSLPLALRLENSEMAR